MTSHDMVVTNDEMTIAYTVKWLCSAHRDGSTYICEVMPGFYC